MLLLIFLTTLLLFSAFLFIIFVLCRQFLGSFVMYCFSFLIVSLFHYFEVYFIFYLIGNLFYFMLVIGAFLLLLKLFILFCFLKNNHSLIFSSYVGCFICYVWLTVYSYYKDHILYIFLNLNVFIIYLFCYGCWEFCLCLLSIWFLWVLTMNYFVAFLLYFILFCSYYHFNIVDVSWWFHDTLYH